MMRNILRINGKHLFNQKRFNSEVFQTEGNYKDVIPFSFYEIDKIVKKGGKIHEKSIIIDKSQKDIFYKFIRHTNSLIYHSLSFKDNSSKDKHSNSLNSNETVFREECEDEEICRRIEKILGFMTKDNLIIILQRSLSSHYYSRSRCWYRLSTITLRNCFLNDQRLSSKDIVKILASLSKWRFSNLSEFEKKLDFMILLNHDWSIYYASQALWSLSHLNMYSLKSFDYLNGIITLKLNEDFDVDSEKDFYESIHRISSANLTRASKTGITNPVLSSIVDFMGRNQVILKCLGPKSVLSLTSLFPYSTYNEKLTESLLELLNKSFYKFTQVQATHILHNFGIIHSELSNKTKNLVIKLLYKFRDLVLSSEFTFIPSVVCKTLYTSLLFLNNTDQDFMSKCLSDLNANLHLLGPFSLIGNLFCLNHILKECSDRLYNRVKESIIKTIENILKFDPNGNVSKSQEGELIPLENMKIWQYSTLKNLGIEYDLYPKFNEFYENLGSENQFASLKNFVLFLSNSFGNRDFVDTNFKNLTLLTCCKLYNPQGSNELISTYWDLISCFMECFKIFHIFKMEVNFDHNHIFKTVHDSLIRVLMCTFGNNDFETILKNTENLALDQERILEDEEIITIKFCVLHSINKTDPEKSRLIFENFYDPKLNFEDLGIKSNENVEKYLRRCLLTSAKPIKLDWIYNKLFFLQDHPKYFINLLPSIVIGETLTIRKRKNNIFRIANWLEENKSWNCLSMYLKNKDKIEEKVEDEKEEIKFIYTNWKISEMAINQVLEDHYVGPWMCHYFLKNRDGNQNLLIFSMDYKFKKTLHKFDEIRRNILSKLGYNFVELFYL